MNILVTRDGQQYGPYSEQEVREYFTTGRLSPNDLAWREDQAGWVPLSRLVNLPPPASQAPPPAPPARPKSIYEQAPVPPVPSPQEQEEAYYNPNAAAIWGAFLSPALSAYLHARNWRRLGDLKKARANWLWFYGLIVFILLSTLLPDLPGGNRTNTSFGLLLFLSWYLSVGKKQLDYFKRLHPDGYRKKSLVLPVLTAFVLLAMLVSAVVYSALAAQRRSPEQIAQAMAEEVRPEILKTWRAKPQLASAALQQVTLAPVDGSEINFAGTVDAAVNGEKVHCRLVVTRHPKDGTYTWQLLDK